MAEIPEIRIRSVGVPRVPDYLMEPPQAIPSSVPVTVQIGFPVVDLPGCIEVHETNNAKNIPSIMNLLKWQEQAQFYLSDVRVIPQSHKMLKAL